MRQFAYSTSSVPDTELRLETSESLLAVEANLLGLNGGKSMSSSEDEELIVIDDCKATNISPYVSVLSSSYV